MANVTSVTILGTVYKIACPPEESEAVEQAAVFLDGKLKELRESSSLDENKAAIITALNISNEYLKDAAKGKQVDVNQEGIIRLGKEVKKHLKSISLLED
jgi:cell division protein ZapA